MDLIKRIRSRERFSDIAFFLLLALGLALVAVAFWNIYSINAGYAEAVDEYDQLRQQYENAEQAPNAGAFTAEAGVMPGAGANDLAADAFTTETGVMPGASANDLAADAFTAEAGVIPGAGANDLAAGIVFTADGLYPPIGADRSFLSLAYESGSPAPQPYAPLLSDPAPAHPRYETNLAPQQFMQLAAAPPVTQPDRTPKATQPAQAPSAAKPDRASPSPQPDMPGAPALPPSAADADPSPPAAFTPFHKSLYDINPDYIGWIKVEETNISYPVVRGPDNEKYLDTTFMGAENSSGAIFMDCRCAEGFGGPVCVIYGHNMKNGTMFAQLRRFLEPKYMDKGLNVSIETTAGEVLTYKIFKARQTGARDLEFSRVFHKYPEAGHIEGAPEGAEKIIILSTCVGASSNDERLLVYAALITD